MNTTKDNRRKAIEAYTAEGPNDGPNDGPEEKALVELLDEHGHSPRHRRNALAPRARSD